MTELTHKDAMKSDIWNIFTADPTTGVSVLTIDGTLVYINEQSIRVFFNETRDPDTVTGRSLYDLGFPTEWVDERVRLFEKIKATGEAILLRTVWHGKQQFSWMSLIDADGDGDKAHVLVITRRIPATEEAKFFLDGEHEVFNSDFIQLGELKVLTPRELEVLALLGQGMSIKEIAGALFRSVKTIENHRESIGRKLKKTRGVELSCIAHIAGLNVEDSARKRIGND